VKSTNRKPKQKPSIIKTKQPNIFKLVNGKLTPKLGLFSPGILELSDQTSKPIVQTRLHSEYDTPFKLSTTRPSQASFKSEGKPVKVPNATANMSYSGTIPTPTVPFAPKCSPLDWQPTDAIMNYKPKSTTTKVT